MTLRGDMGDEIVTTYIWKTFCSYILMATEFFICMCRNNNKFANSIGYACMIIKQSCFMILFKNCLCICMQLAIGYSSDIVIA